jgi:transposase
MYDDRNISPTLQERLESQSRIIEEQAGVIKRLGAELEKLREENARLKKNSTNSSKPPSSDIVKPPRPKPKGKKRKRGGQKGQPRRDCKLTLEQAQEIVPYYPERESCEKCDTRLEKDDKIELRITYQYELPEQPVTLTAHVSHGKTCPSCGEVHYGKIPPEVRKAGLLGPRLTAFLTTIRAEGNASLSGCQDILKALGVEIARSTICNALERMRRALQETYDKLLGALPHETRLNIDETTLPQDGKKLWIWAFVARTFTLYKVDPSRSSAVLESVLGPDCRAIIGSDLFGAYTKFAKTASIELQLCWAHLIRDLLLIAESQNKSIANYGKRMLAVAKKIFRTWHRRADSNAKRTERKLEKLKTEFLAKGTRTQAGGLAQTMSKRLQKEGARYFTFVDHPDLEPTNNIAEQQIRQCVLNRRVTQGVRGEKGQRFWENTWTVLATLRRRKQNAFGFLSAAASAYFKSEPAPDL